MVRGSVPSDPQPPHQRRIKHHRKFVPATPACSACSVHISVRVNPKKPGRLRRQVAATHSARASQRSPPRSMHVPPLLPSPSPVITGSCKGQRGGVEARGPEGCLCRHERQPDGDLALLGRHGIEDGVSNLLRLLGQRG